MEGNRCLTGRPEATGEISLQLPSLPEGVTAAPAKIGPGASEAQVILKVDVDAPAANVDLVATGEMKVADATVTATSPALALTIVEAPGFTLAVEPKEITAPQKLSMRFVPTDLESLAKDLEIIRKFAARSIILKKAIYDALPALPEIPQTELHPIFDPLLER